MKGRKVTEVWRKLPREELHNYYCFSDIIGMIKSNIIRGTGHMKLWLENVT